MSHSKKQSSVSAGLLCYAIVPTSEISHPICSLHS